MFRYLTPNLQTLLNMSSAYFGTALSFAFAKPPSLAISRMRRLLSRAARVRPPFWPALRQTARMSSRVSTFIALNHRRSRLT